MKGKVQLVTHPSWVRNVDKRSTLRGRRASTERKQFDFRLLRFFPELD